MIKKNQKCQNHEKLPKNDSHQNEKSCHFPAINLSDIFFTDSACQYATFEILFIVIGEKMTFSDFVLIFVEAPLFHKGASMMSKCLYKDMYERG